MLVLIARESTLQTLSQRVASSVYAFNVRRTPWMAPYVAVVYDFAFKAISNEALESGVPARVAFTMAYPG